MWCIPPKRKAIGLVFGVVLASVLWACPAMAHKVFLFAWVEGDQVMVDAYFSKARKVKHGQLQVLDPAGQVLLEGETDDQGAFSFTVPQKTDLKLVIDAGMGHRAEFVITADELPEVTASVATGTEKPPVSAPETAVPVEPAKATVKSDQNPAVSAVPVAAVVDTAQFEKAVASALEARLKPMEDSLHGLQRSLAKLQEDHGPGITEILGGIGWIIGLFGVAAFFRGRSKRQNGD